jgi:outer membrane protein TolC
MAKLSLAESVMQHATHGEELIEAKISFTGISGQAISSNIKFPQQLPGKLPRIKDIEKTLQNHPKVRSAYLSSQAVRQQMHFAKQDRKADPTVGVSVGRDDNDDLLGLTFSMPLQVRNDFSHNVDAAMAETLQAEKEARQIYQDLSSRLNGAFERYNLVAQAWNVWVKQGRQSLKQRLESLDIQWKAGEINTTDYLLQLQQTLDIQVDGVELQGRLWNAWVEWLMASNKLSVWLDQIIKE